MSPSAARAQQRVHQSVRCHVRVAVSQQPQRVGDFHSAEDQFSAFHQPVYVHAMPDANHDSASFSRRRVRMASPKAMSAGVVSFRFSLSPSVR